jgi:hypothetical protein
MPITKIISGGQTGADRGGLDAAIHCKIPHGGWCPKGRKAEDGVIPAKYIQQEMASSDYLVRAEANVVDSDATVIFTMGALEGGSLKTAQYAKKHDKPCLHLDLEGMSRKESVQSIVKWLQESCPSDCILNIAGSRGSKAPSLQSAVMVRMVDVISKVNGTLFYPLCDGYMASDTGREFDGVLQNVMLNKSPNTKPRIFSPKTIDEAVDIVVKKMSAKSRESIRDNPDKDGFITEQHFGMGLWVRNSLIHQNPYMLDLMADYQRGQGIDKWTGYPPAEPDTVSAAIVGLVWERLHKGGI